MRLKATFSTHSETSHEASVSQSDFSFLKSISTTTLTFPNQLMMGPIPNLFIVAAIISIHCLFFHEYIISWYFFFHNFPLWSKQQILKCYLVVNISSKFTNLDLSRKRKTDCLRMRVCVCLCMLRGMLANRLSEAINDTVVVTWICFLSITHCTHKCYQLFGYWHLKHTNIQQTVYTNKLIFIYVNVNSEPSVMLQDV